MSHLEKIDTVVYDKIENAVRPTLATPVIRILADMKKLIGSFVFLFAGVLVLASCGGTSTTTTTASTYPNAGLLVSGAALNVNATNQVIVDTRSATEYAAGHITNAINIPPSALDTTATSYELNTPAAVAAVLGAKGVSNTANIVLYDKDVYANVGRVFWALEYLGAKNVQVLDGGYAKWVADSRTVVTTATTLAAATFTPTVDATKLATMADVNAHYADTGNYAIVDSRDAKDFTAGRIPNAVNALVGDFLNKDKTVLSYTKLKSLLDFKGITAGKKVITHCYVGYRSGQEYFIHRLMGFNVSNYDGSWTEWSAATTYPNAGLLVDNTALAGAVIIDARSAALYNAGHIPGAVNVLHSDYWAAGTGLKATATLETQLGAAGISPTSRIVIYDNTTASWGAAGRLFWMLEYLGASDVHILNGGYDKWVADVANTPEITANTLPAATFTASVQATKKLTGAEIKTKLANANFAVIDARTDEEFNGWQLYGETRGGHIPGAVNIPYATFFNADKTTLSYQSLKLMFESRGITTGKEVTAYCTAGIRSGHVYFLLRLMGYTNASNYDASMFEWSAADTATYPEEKAPNFKDLVYPKWVNDLIAYHASASTSAAPPEYKDAAGVAYDRTTHKYLILETQWGTTAQQTTGYLAGHIPGAIHSDTDPWETGATDPLYSLLPDANLKTRAGELGITPDTTVVVYSNDPVFAARLWWLLKYLGVTDVRMLNGGYAAWTGAGYTGETTENIPVATTYTGTVNPAVIATTANVLSTYYTSASTQMVDVRSDKEYLGTTSGYSYLDLMGRIPGAVWAYNGSGSDYADADGTLRDYTQVKSMWSSLGIKSTGVATLLDKDVVFYCGGGYRSGLTYFYAHLMGYTNIRNYADGWAGWSTAPSAWGTTQTATGRPVASGL